MAKAFKPIPDCVHNLLSYDPDTGVFTHKNPRSSSYIGKTAGYARDGRYWYLGVGGTEYLAHRVAYFMYHGEQPGMIDHINRNGRDNRIVNLRVVTASEQQLNRDLWRPRFYANPRRQKPFWYADYRGRRVYQGKNIMLAYFRRRMAVVADLPVGIEHHP